MARSEICWMMLFCMRSNSFSSRESSARARLSIGGEALMSPVRLPLPTWCRTSPGRRRQPQAIKNAALLFLAGNGLAVAAAAPPARRSAGASCGWCSYSDPCADGVRAATFRAIEQVTEQVARRALHSAGYFPRNRTVHRSPSDLLHPLPKIVGDDAHLRHISQHPFGCLVGARGTAFSLRVLAIVTLVPDHAADIALIVENAGATADVTANGGIAPLQATRAGMPSLFKR